MSTVLHQPLPVTGRSRVERRAKAASASAFPWLLFLVTWLGLFLLWDHLDSPVTWLDSQTADNLAQGAKEGSASGRMIIMVLGGLGASLVARSRHRIRINRPYASIAFCFFGWTLLSGLWAGDRDIATRRLVALGCMLVFAAGCAVYVRTRQLTSFLAGIPLLSLGPEFIAEMHYGTFHPLDPESRFVGGAPHPNVEAATLSVACVLLYWLVWRARGRQRWGLGFAAIVTTGFLIDTGSRTSLLAVSMALGASALLVVFRDYRRSLPMLVVSALLCFTLFSLGNLYLQNTSGRAVGINSLHSARDEGDVTSFNGRLELWRTLLTFVRERPITGFGYGSFWSPRHIEYVSADQGWAIQQSHSSYMEMALALGVPGLSLYLALLWGCLAMSSMRFLRGQDGYGPFAALTIFILIHNLTEAINVNPIFSNFAVNVVLLHLALTASPHRASARALEVRQIS